MRHLLMGAAVLALWPGPAAAQDGEARFEAECAYCHDRGIVVAWVSGRPAAQRRAYLEQLLTDHYAPDEAIRAAILEYLLEEVERN